MTKSKLSSSGVLLIIGILFAAFAYQQGWFYDKISKNECQQLVMAFDGKNENCENWYITANNGTVIGNGPPLWVGGTLTGIEDKGSFYSERYFVLTFKSLNKTREIHLLTYMNSISYSTGEFYKFNLANICRTYQSAMYSGMFSDPNLTEFKSVKC